MWEDSCFCVKGNTLQGETVSDAGAAERKRKIRDPWRNLGADDNERESLVIYLQGDVVGDRHGRGKQVGSVSSSASLTGCSEKYTLERRPRAVRNYE